MGRRRSDEARQHETTDYPMAHLGEETTPSATGDAGSIPEADIVTFAPHIRTCMAPCQEPRPYHCPAAFFSVRFVRINTNYRGLQ
jgi:hypothetical protein